jgi:hypothetical protein
MNDSGSEFVEAPVSFYELTIQTTICRPAAPPEIVEPFEEELRSLFGIQLESHHYDREPPAAGMSEIAITLSILGSSAGFGVWALKSFFEPVITEAGERFRDRVFQLSREATRSAESQREYIPLIIQFGAQGSEFSTTPVRYVFQDIRSLAELEERLEAASEHIRQLPNNLFTAPDGPIESSFFWDRDTRTWRGNVYLGEAGIYGEEWMPQIFGTAEDGSRHV